MPAVKVARSQGVTHATARRIVARLAHGTTMGLRLAPRAAPSRAQRASCRSTTRFPEFHRSPARVTAPANVVPVTRFKGVLAAKAALRTEPRPPREFSFLVEPTRYAAAIHR